MHIVNETPAYKKLYEGAVADGWRIRQKPGEGSFASEEYRYIQIDSDLPPTYKAYVLAHELGHYKRPPYVTKDTSLPRDEFVRRNVDGMLMGEGDAQAYAQWAHAHMMHPTRGPYTSSGAADPLAAFGGRSSGDPAATALRASEEYPHFSREQIEDLVARGMDPMDAAKPYMADHWASYFYSRYRAGSLTADDLVRKLGEDVFRKNMSTTGENYRQFWTEYYGKLWDKANP
jgi:hypothetical protein